ncbi:hypothetical protein CDD82_2804 [Ophiocordyceps australis]|uniref:NADH-ubiquinone oxidoreductase B15 subunit n=1 Tax=Ophiocordyceps australis TaxID=1399860 RepID=A0A2C5ZG62_9HYPO|nr:hypothetical protein CDD82_2804 [Ophiocordyceps australis]
MAHLRVKPDPGLLKLQAMQKNRHKYFRWTPRTAGTMFIFLAVVPTILGYAAIQTDGLIDFKGKRKGDTLYER